MKDYCLITYHPIVDDMPVQTMYFLDGRLYSRQDALRYMYSLGFTLIEYIKYASLLPIARIKSDSPLAVA